MKKACVRIEELSIDLSESQFQSAKEGYFYDIQNKVISELKKRFQEGETFIESVDEL